MNPEFGALVRAAGTAICVLSVGCDAQVSKDYAGESLLRVVGSVEFTDGSEHDELVPALAYYGKGGGSVVIVDVAVGGSFPTDFRLDIYDPPPESTRERQVHQIEGEPRVSIGYIAAAAKDHPDQLAEGTSSFSQEFAPCAEPREDGRCLVLEDKQCATLFEDMPCYVEKTYCPSPDSPREECVIEKSGDPLLAGSAWDYFAGYSRTYMIAYLEEKAHKGSATAAWFGVDDDIPQGYGLYKRQSFTPEERQATFECQVKSGEIAIKLYNEEHGTDYENWDCPAIEDVADPDSLPAFCQVTDAEARSQNQSVYWEMAQLQLGCSLNLQHLERVEHPDAESISIRLDSKYPANP